MQPDIARALVQQFSESLDAHSGGWVRDERTDDLPPGWIAWTRRQERWIREWLVLVPFERYDHFRIQLGATLGSDPDVRCPGHQTVVLSGRPSSTDIDQETGDIMIDLFELFGPENPKEILPWGIGGVVDRDTLRAPRTAPIPPELAAEELPELVDHAVDKVVRFADLWFSELRTVTPAVPQPDDAIILGGARRPDGGRRSGSRA